MDKLNHIIKLARQSGSQELPQSLVRLMMVIVVTIYLLIYYSVFPEKEIVTPFIWAVTTYFIYCVILVIHILFYIEFNPARHYFTIVFDMILLGIGMYSGSICWQH
ncbi:MAG: hypothetical protein P8Y24_01260 [Gammaproteobacteria bacterium]